jgi:predicted alpha/beta superfamily hydrolase
VISRLTVHGFKARRWSLAVLLSWSAAGATAAQTAATAAQAPITIGVSHRVKSAALQETRTVNVVLPASYSKEPSRRYPILYLLDGGLDQDLLHVAGVVQLGAIWGRSAEAIVVGLESKDRRKELAGPTSDPELLKRFPTAGSSAKFREFIRNEVKPLIERSYRSNGHDVVLGESLAGLFVTETYLVEPTLFDGYAAVDPSLWWDKEALSKGAAAKLGPQHKGRSLMLTVAKEQLEDPAASRRLVSLLGKGRLTYCVLARPDLTHATIYQQITPWTVQYLLPAAEPPPSEYGFSLECAKEL